jgi:hypothetical protein
MDPRQHVNPGDPIRLAASQINGLNRLLNLNPGFSFPAAPEQPTPYTWVMAKNNTGSNIERWGVLAITGMDITPGTSQTATGQFEQLPVVTGGTPSATTTAWCVAVEPIESGKIGRVAVGGVVQCKVEVTSADDKFVACKASTAELKTGTTGEGLILWKDSGTGAGKWALVRLGTTATTELDVVTGVTLESGGIKITKETVYVIGKKDPKPADTTISTTACT